MAETVTKLTAAFSAASETLFLRFRLYKDGVFQWENGQLYRPLSEDAVMASIVMPVPEVEADEVRAYASGVEVIGQTVTVSATNVLGQPVGSTPPFGNGEGIAELRPIPIETAPPVVIVEPAPGPGLVYDPSAGGFTAEPAPITIAPIIEPVLPAPLPPAMGDPIFEPQPLPVAPITIEPVLPAPLPPAIGDPIFELPVAPAPEPGLTRGDFISALQGLGFTYSEAVIYLDTGLAPSRFDVAVIAQAQALRNDYNRVVGSRDDPPFLPAPPDLPEPVPAPVVPWNPEPPYLPAPPDLPEPPVAPAPAAERAGLLLWGVLAYLGYRVLAKKR